MYGLIGLNALTSQCKSVQLSAQKKYSHLNKLQKYDKEIRPFEKMKYSNFNQISLGDSNPLQPSLINCNSDENVIQEMQKEIK